MIKIYRLIFCLLFLFSGTKQILAQNRDSSGFHIAVFLPLYLDSAFDASGNYRFDQNFPKYLNPGLEFYEGMELAMDSLQKRGARVDITVYDTRNGSKSIKQMLEEPAFAKMELMIGHVTPDELRLL